MYLVNCTRPNIDFSVNLFAGTVPFQPKDIGIVSNIYYATSKKQLI